MKSSLFFILLYATFPFQWTSFKIWFHFPQTLTERRDSDWYLDPSEHPDLRAAPPHAALPVLPGNRLSALIGGDPRMACQQLGQLPSSPVLASLVSDEPRALWVVQMWEISTSPLTRTINKHSERQWPTSQSHKEMPWVAVSSLHLGQAPIFLDLSNLSFCPSFCCCLAVGEGGWK